MARSISHSHRSCLQREREAILSGLAFISIYFKHVDNLTGSDFQPIIVGAFTKDLVKSCNFVRDGSILLEPVWP